MTQVGDVIQKKSLLGFSPSKGTVEVVQVFTIKCVS